MQTETTPSFENLPLAKTPVPDSLVGMYRVYKDVKNYTVIQASSALEALESSGFGHAFKIERESFYSMKLINPKFWGDGAAPPPAVAKSAVSAPDAAEVEPTEAPPAADAPLSNNDIDKLLNG